MNEHTPEPWSCEWGIKPIIFKKHLAGGSTYICDHLNQDNANRIVACVNACAGINPEAVPLMLATMKKIDKHISDEYGMSMAARKEMRRVIDKAEEKS